MEQILVDKKEWERLHYIEYNYDKLKDEVKQLNDNLNALEIFMEHDLKDEDVEEI